MHILLLHISANLYSANVYYRHLLHDISANVYSANSLSLVNTGTNIPRLIDKVMVRETISIIKNWKAAGPSGVVMGKGTNGKGSMRSRRSRIWHDHRLNKSDYSRSYYSRMGAYQCCKLL